MVVDIADSISATRKCKWDYERMRSSRVSIETGWSDAYLLVMSNRLWRFSWASTSQVLRSREGAGGQYKVLQGRRKENIREISQKDEIGKKKWLSISCVGSQRGKKATTGSRRSKHDFTNSRKGGVDITGGGKERGEESQRQFYQLVSGFRESSAISKKMFISWRRLPIRASLSG